MLEPVYDWTARLAEGGTIPPVLAHPFMVRSILATLLLAPLLGSLSPIVVTKRMAFLSSALGHAALAGVSLGLLLGEAPDALHAGPFGLALLLALGVTFIRNRSALPSDTVIGVFLSFTLGLGICLLVAVTRRFNIHQIEAMLFGSVLTVGETDLAILAALAIPVALVLVRLGNGLLLASLEPSIARLRSVAVVRNEYLFVATLTVVVVASVEIAGALLVEALAVVPAAAARNLARDLRGWFAWSVAIAVAGSQAGILASAFLPVPSGAAIVLALALCFLLTFAWRLVAGGIRRAP